MSIVVIDGLDNRTNSDTVKNYCQNFGRIINCYNKLNQCFVTFADKHYAEEFIRASPHRIDCNGPVNATWKINFESTTSFQTRSISTNINDPCRLIIRGTIEQLEEKNLLKYFSRYGHVRMCLSNSNQGFATIIFDDRISAERVLKESRHFLNGRSLIVESSTTIDSNKRMKLSDTNQSLLTSQIQSNNEQLLLEQKTNLQNQFQQYLQLYEYEKQQWNHYLTKQQMEYLQQINHYQTLLKQSQDEILNKDKQIEQLKQDNKDIDDLLRQSVHDNEQQQIHLRKREEIHNQTKRKYEELYKAYMKLKDDCSSQNDIDKNKSKSTIDNVRKKL